MDYKLCLNGFFDIVKKCESFSDSEFVAKVAFIMYPNFMTRRIWRREDFESTVHLPFEILSLPAPSGYVNILDKFYGNWHEYYIRERHGSFYDVERPYTYYAKKECDIDEDMA